MLCLLVCPCRVLVCAQSNAAVDELVTRIATKGLVGWYVNGICSYYGWQIWELVKV